MIYLENLIAAITSKKGSSIVEASIIFPILMLVIFGIIGISLKYYAAVKTSSLEEIDVVRESIEEVTPESILRAKWVTE